MGVIAAVLVGVVILLAVALLLSLNEGGLREEDEDHGDLGLPDRVLTAQDIPGLRFRTGLRGYRMEDVDAALERISEALTVAQQSPAAPPPSTGLPVPTGAVSSDPRVSDPAAPTTDA